MRSAAGPLPVQELIEKMLLALPSSARDPQRNMRKHIREASGECLVFLDADTVLPLRLAYQGIRFRIPLERESFNNGLLPLDNLLSYLPRSYQADHLQLADALGNAIPFQLQTITQKVQYSFGLYDQTRSYINLGAWYQTQKMHAEDHLLVTTLDWEQGILQLEREPSGQHNQALLAERDQLLADMFFGLLEGAHNEEIYGREAVPTVYARLPDKSGCPSSHWMQIIASDGRMASDGWRISYRDRLGPLFEQMMDSDDEIEEPGDSLLSDEQRQMVYRFKAHLVGRPSLWREIEIQGEHTLANLDRELRDAFNHDTFDHMGGFWKLIPRAAHLKTTRSGRAARMREVEIGDVEPGGGGDGARITIAELDLAAGAELKYVYDFGDWIEHRLTLLAIEAPQSEVEYPREVSRNKPRFSYCVECKEEGKKEIARLICIECSNELQQNYLLCEACAEKHDDDHYIDDLLY